MVEAIWKPAPNYWAGRGGERVRAICLHVSEGSRASVYSWFSSPLSDASAHYLVNQDGSVWQFVREEDTAWANGAVNAPDRSIGWLDDCLRRGQNPNRLTVSIETERHWQEPLTALQYVSLLALIRDILARHDLPVAREHLIPHAAIDGVNRAHCPGNVDWARLFADLRAGERVVFPPTGQALAGPFLAFWREHGGLPIFGYPVTGELQEGGLRVQYTERARLEWHPEAPPDARVQLGRVGAELLAARGRQ